MSPGHESITLDLCHTSPLTMEMAATTRFFIPLRLKRKVQYKRGVLEMFSLEEVTKWGIGESGCQGAILLGHPVSCKSAVNSLWNEACYRGVPNCNLNLTFRTQPRIWLSVELWLLQTFKSHLEQDQRRKWVIVIGEKGICVHIYTWVALPTRYQHSPLIPLVMTATNVCRHGWMNPGRGGGVNVTPGCDTLNPALSPPHIHL